MQFYTSGKYLASVLLNDHYNFTTTFDLTMEGLRNKSLPREVIIIEKLLHVRQIDRTLIMCVCLCVCWTIVKHLACANKIQLSDDQGSHVCVLPTSTSLEFWLIPIHKNVHQPQIKLSV